TAELKQREDELRKQSAAFETAKAKLQEAEFTAFDKQQAYTFTKSNLDEAYYYFTLAKHEQTPSHTGPEVERKFAERKEKLEELERPMKELERKYLAAKDKSGSGPMGLFGPATEIQQQNIEDLGRVDRCESCHLGADRGGFEKVEPAYFRSHPYRRTLFALHPVEKFGCTTCHDGQGRATQRFYAHAPIDDKGVPNPHYAETHFWEEPLLKSAFMEANCRKCHTEEYELRSYLRCEASAECPQS